MYELLYEQTCPLINTFTPHHFQVTSPFYFENNCEPVRAHFHIINISHSPCKIHFTRCKLASV